jgi:1-deoxy-D-xylulose-5-phosphate reductoisomerase
VTRPLRVAVLGSTGSIGRQALEVAREHSDRIEIVALAANRSADLVCEQCREFGVVHLALADATAATQARKALHSAVDVGSGAAAVVELARCSDADMVLNALVGAAGLRATIAALEAGKKLALANKESLVVGGELVMALAEEGQLIPVDSEHSAIFQCYLGEDARDVKGIWLTASGGPFRGRSRERLRGVTAAEALSHPTWNMGPKITVDSASLMNKGLEVIEAHHLFGVSIDDVRVVVHPQSCVHSMVEFADGSVKAHLGATDMRIPIQYAFSHPRRWKSVVSAVDFAALGRLEFGEPDFETFGCLRLALEAGRAAGTAPAALNAANEVAVAAFLAGECGFLDIESTVAAVLDAVDVEPLLSVEQIEEVDARSRSLASEWLRRSLG